MGSRANIDNFFSSSLEIVSSLILFKLFATGIVETCGKFATGFNNTSGTGGNLMTVSLIPVENFSLALVTLVANLPPVSLIPVVHRGEDDS